MAAGYTSWITSGGKTMWKRFTKIQLGTCIRAPPKHAQRMSTHQYGQVMLLCFCTFCCILNWLTNSEILFLMNQQHGTNAAVAMFRQIKPYSSTWGWNKLLCCRSGWWNNTREQVRCQGFCRSSLKGFCSVDAVHASRNIPFPFQHGSRLSQCKENTDQSAKERKKSPTDPVSLRGFDIVFCFCFCVIWQIVNCSDWSSTWESFESFIGGWTPRCAMESGHSDVCGALVVLSACCLCTVIHICNQAVHRIVNIYRSSLFQTHLCQWCNGNKKQRGTTLWVRCSPWMSPQPFVEAPGPWGALVTPKHTQTNEDSAAL